MLNKSLLKKIVRQQIKQRSNQFFSLKAMTSILCFFLTSISTILCNEMNILGEDEAYISLTIALFFLVLIYIVSFYSVAYLHLYRDKDNYSILAACGMTTKELEKSMKFLGNYLTGKELFGSGFAGIGTGLLITWQYKTISGKFYSLLLLLLIYLCIQNALKICIRNILKNPGKSKKKRQKKSNCVKLNTISMAVKYLVYNLGRTLIITGSLFFSGLIICFSLSVIKSIDVDKYIEDNWGDHNYKVSLYDSTNPEGGYHLLQIDNPLSEELETEILGISGVKSIGLVYSLETSFAGDNGIIESSLNCINDDIYSNCQIEKLEIGEAVISINESLMEKIEQTIKKGQIICTVKDGNSDKKLILNIVSTVVDNSKGIWIYTSFETISEVAVNSSPIFAFKIYGEENEAVLTAIDELIAGKKLELENREVYSAEARAGLQILIIGIIVIMVILVLFAMTLCVNIKLVSIATRKETFIILEILGMSHWEIKKMLIIEDLICNIPIVLVSWILGNILSFYVCRGMDKIGATFMVYQTSFFSMIYVLIMFAIITFIGIKIYKFLHRTVN